jgi:glutathione peroxidase
MSIDRFPKPASGGAMAWVWTPQIPEGSRAAAPSQHSIALAPEDPTVLARMLLTILPAAAAALLLPVSWRVVLAQTSPKKPASVLDFTMKDIDGKDVPLAKYQGKVLLLVNTASQCGYTPQYKGLQEIYQKYKEQGLEILAFPANEFGAQEPGTDEQIKQFCSTKYKVSFPLFSKIVVKGKEINPLYAYLTGESTNPKFSGTIRWNFAKFLVNRKGEVIARFEPGTRPESAKLTAAIENALAEK